MRTDTAVIAYNALNDAKLGKLSGTEQYQVITVMRSLRPIAEEYTKNVQLVQEKVKDERHDEMEAKRKELTNIEASGKEAPAKDVREVNEYFAAMNQRAVDLLKGINEEEQTLSFEKAAKELINKLIESNDFTGRQLMALDEVLS